SHVDAHLQRRRCDHRRQTALLQGLFRLLPYLQRHAAVVSAGDLLVLVQKSRDALDGAAVVGEDQRRAVGANLLLQESVDRRPDRFLRQRAEVLDRAEDTEVEVLAQSRVDQGDGPRAQLALIDLATTEEAGNLVERPLCRRQADADEVARDAATVGR